MNPGPYDMETQLHAVVDGECDADLLLDIFTRMQRDPDYAAKGCEIARAKDLVRLAYADIEPPSRPTDARKPVATRRRRRRVSPFWKPFVLGATAATMLLALGLGWLAAVWLPAERPLNRFVLLDPDGSGQAPANPMREETRILFQVTDPDQAQAGKILDDVEKLLTTYATKGKALRVELVAHGEGLTLFRERLSRHAERIARLAQTYNNLTFVACRNSMSRIGAQQGFPVLLLPHVRIIESATHHVAERQEQGWAYIRL